MGISNTSVSFALHLGADGLSTYRAPRWHLCIALFGHAADIVIQMRMDSEN